ncbi:MAG: hypothetical protein ACR2IA_08875 [Pyrinomonadaceae bacterium]
MPKLNWDNILYNIKDVREQLEEIENLAVQGKPPSEVELQIKLEHAFHHLSFAWNVRNVSSQKHSKMTDKDFNNWSKFPKEMKPYKIKKK